MALRTAQPRSRVPSNALRVRFDRFELDEANATLLREGEPVTLPPTPFAVLCALARQPATLLTKEALLDNVWGHQFVSESVLKTAISDLRSALDDDARRPRLIETVSRRGYRFIAATTPISTQQPQSSMALARTRAASRVYWPRRRFDPSQSSMETCVQRQACDRLGRRRTGHRQNDADRAFHLRHRRRCLRTRAMRRALWRRRILSAGARSDSGPVPHRQRRCRALLRQVAPTWLLQLPWLSTAEERDALRRDLAGVAPERMLREMGEALDRYTERRPLLLVLEDLHWSDSATVHLLDYIARRRRSARLMCLASFRITEVVAAEHPLKSLRHELRLHGLSQEIVLDPFSEADVGEFVKQRAPSLADNETFVRSLHERTDGVPLFLAAVLDEVMARHADDESQVHHTDGFATRGGARKSRRDHRPLHRQARQRTASHALGSRDLRHGVSSHDGCRDDRAGRRKGGRDVRRIGAPAPVARSAAQPCGRRRARAAVCFSARAFSASVVRAHTGFGSHASASQNRFSARTRACERNVRRCIRTRLALRARSRAARPHCAITSRAPNQRLRT